MAKDGAIVRFSRQEIEAKRVRGESRSDFAAVRAKSEAELERDIAGDPDFRDVPANWYEAAEAVMPVTKQMLSLRLDTDVVAWFREQGPGYQTRINAVLRSYVNHQARKGGKTAP
jgi:uncharacterized protein (DUF4415 family)